MSKHIQAISEQMLSRKAVAERWQTSVETIKRRERAGLIKPLRFNSRLIRYRLADVEALEAAAAGAKE
jgi:predicted site-specific integrase-resolvase